MVPRKAAQELVVGTLTWILRLQQSPARAQPEHEASQQETEAGADAAEAGATAAAAPKRAARLRMRKPKPEEVTPQRGLDEVTFSGAAGCVLAGVQDGSASACAQCGEESLAASAVTKHAGRVFGSMCVANLALRTGMLMYALVARRKGAGCWDAHCGSISLAAAPLHAPSQSTRPLSSRRLQVRLHDAAEASIHMLELYSINQLQLERGIEDLMKEDASHKRVRAQADSSLEPVDVAAKRFLTGLLSYRPPCGTDPWQAAVRKGVPTTLPRKSFWLAVRQSLLTRKRKHAEARRAKTWPMSRSGSKNCSGGKPEEFKAARAFKTRCRCWRASRTQLAGRRFLCGFRRSELASGLATARTCCYDTLCRGTSGCIPWTSARRPCRRILMSRGWHRLSSSEGR